jgi:hypothetical protein
MSVVLHTSILSRVLKKKHIAIPYHCKQEAIVDKVIRLAYVKGEENASDILSQPSYNEKFH